MNRRKFISIAGVTTVMAAGGYYWSTDKSNFVRDDILLNTKEKFSFQKDEREILYLASLAPSGHNTQPWFIKYVEPYHWIIGNDKSKWLPGVDPTQRETMLSIGAFLQNLEYAASNLGYSFQCEILAKTNQDETIAAVKLTKLPAFIKYDTALIKLRRTVRSNYLSDVLKPADVAYVTGKESRFFYLIPNTAKEFKWLNEQTIEANRIQAYRNFAQKELANWIRFSSQDAQKHRDGLTLGSMEIEGVPAWVLRNFYKKEDVMKSNFREQSIDAVKKQVTQSAGWLLITSKDSSPGTLIETGKRLQRMLLKVRERNIAIHPMTQIIEESAIGKSLNSSIGISDPIQFILRTGYVKNYPRPVSLRRPVEWFVRTV
ncbi:Acg family FMN-binding oxidoreductase [Arcticibacter eurypsychrophilus]|uniref:Acg family FMN-binding oxidoreductase n=1 Tax=Arcticibacter eurypsychrophilus TaxID=1434752 RepID=UPI00084D6C33|nr:nitroreductase [Arcticibacter eurypsychrophilus]